MEKTIQINGRDVVIKKIPLKKYAELVSAFEELPKHFKELSGKKNEEILTMVPQLIGSCYPDVARVFAVATDLPTTEIDEIGLDDAVRIIEALMEVNDFSYIIDKVKKITAHQGIKQPEAKMAITEKQVIE